MIRDNNGTKMTARQFAINETVGWMDVIIKSVDGRRTTIDVGADDFTERERKKVIKQMLRIRRIVSAMDKTLNLDEGELHLPEGE